MIVNAPTSSAAASGDQKYGFSSLGAGDFIKLMTAQMQMQDPFEPVDNKEMLAQMAQFSSLSATTSMGDTLKDIAKKLDAVLASQAAAAASPAPAAPTPDPA
jgi:flagellar basal-body rod modification protein FlgD